MDDIPIFGVIKETGVDDQGLVDFCRDYFRYPIYRDQGYAFYRALGDRKAFSMFWNPFAILKMAAEENRRAFLVNFSVGIQVLDLHDISRSLDDIAKFLQMSFYSGTSIPLALIEVLRQLET